jgi:hypothetical protein
MFCGRQSNQLIVKLDRIIKKLEEQEEKIDTLETKLKEQYDVL